MKEPIYNVKIINTITSWEVMSVIVSVIAAIFSIGLFVVAFIQLRNLVKNNSLKTILDLEAELHQRQSKMADISSRIRVAKISSQDTLIEIYFDDLEAAEEIYYNALDRICYCILKGYLKDRDWKLEYQSLIRETIYSNKSAFGPDSSYTNIMVVHKKWTGEDFWAAGEVEE